MSFLCTSCGKSFEKRMRRPLGCVTPDSCNVIEAVVGASAVVSANIPMITGDVPAAESGERVPTVTGQAPAANDLQSNDASPATPALAQYLDSIKTAREGLAQPAESSAPAPSASSPPAGVPSQAAAPRASRLLIMSGDEILAANDGAILGRQGDIVPTAVRSDTSVSRRHVRFDFTGQVWMITNIAASGSPVLVDGVRVDFEKSLRLTPGTHRVELGDTFIAEALIS